MEGGCYSGVEHGGNDCVAMYEVDPVMQRGKGKSSCVEGG